MASGSDVKVTVTIEPEDARKMATEVVALREELADVRAQWQADVGSAIARAQTAEDAQRRAEMERSFMMRKYYEIKRANAQRRDAARKVAQWVRSEIDEYRLDVEDAHQRRYKVQAERDFARAEAARLRDDLTEAVYLLVEARRMGFIIATAETVGWASRVDAHIAALRGPAQSEKGE